MHDWNSANKETNSCPCPRLDFDVCHRSSPALMQHILESKHRFSPCTDPMSHAVRLTLTGSFTHLDVRNWAAPFDHFSHCQLPGSWLVQEREEIQRLCSATLVWYIHAGSIEITSIFTLPLVLHPDLESFSQVCRVPSQLSLPQLKNHERH